MYLTVHPMRHMRSVAGIDFDTTDYANVFLIRIPQRKPFQFLRAGLKIYVVPEHEAARKHIEGANTCGPERTIASVNLLLNCEI